jgi:predicted O-methyltransferase YrrM
MAGMQPARILTLPETYGAAGGLAAGVLTGLLAYAGFTAPEAVAPVAIVAGVVIATGVRGRQGARIIAKRRDEQARSASRKLGDRLATLEIQLREVQAAASFSAMDSPYPLPLGGWALDHEAAAVLAREVATGRPDTVVELGSGASTLVIGLQLRRTGRGHLYSLEHDPEYAERTRRHVQALDLGAFVSVLDAPLVPYALGSHTYSWYEVPAAVAALDRVDLLLVDGPPQATDRDGTPRYPALPVLGAKLGPGSVAIVDDAGRDPEQRMLERWRSERPDLSQEVIPTRHGLAVLRVPPG